MTLDLGQAMFMHVYVITFDIIFTHPLDIKAYCCLNNSCIITTVFISSFYFEFCWYHNVRIILLCAKAYRTLLEYIVHAGQNFLSFFLIKFREAQIYNWGFWLLPSTVCNIDRSFSEFDYSNITFSLFPYL